MSAPSRSLRRRVLLTSLLLGACLSVLFGGAMVIVAESYEHILIEEILRGQAEDYSLRLSGNLGASLPRTRRLSGYLRRPDGSTDAPAEFASLPAGIHELELREGEHVGVFDTPHGRFYFVIDLSDIEQLEQLLAICLIVVLLGGTAVAGWLGWLMADTTIAPVTRLARAVDGLPVQPQVTTLSRDLADDELGRLAQAIDRYQQRLFDADAAERAFFADASHELRTPVAVVRGAVELLAEDAQDAGTRRRVMRLERGVGELTDLIDMLLSIVRRRDVDTTGSAEEVIASALSEWADVPARIAVTDAPALPRRETALLLRSILRRLVVPDSQGTLFVAATRDAIAITYRTAGDGDNAGLVDPVRSDRGFGLTLARRLAGKVGWHIDEGANQVRIRWGT